jgi:hypothetical protein
MLHPASYSLCNKEEQTADTTINQVIRKANGWDSLIQTKQTTNLRGIAGIKEKNGLQSCCIRGSHEKYTRLTRRCPTKPL